MVELAILLGIFSYVIFGLGIMSLPATPATWLAWRARDLGILFLLSIVLLIIKKKPWRYLFKLWNEVKEDKISLILVGLIILQILVNLIGALGPELGFDALWYHLTIPKIFLQQGRIFFIKGGLFYYSAMPKLTEMLYLLSLVFSSSGTLAKIIHFLFGIGCAVNLFNLTKRYLKTRDSLLVCLIFYTTLVVGWQSITAYVDLARTFFEILALDLFLKWAAKTDKKVFLFESAVMLGLAISTKLLAFASLPIFLILIILKSKKFLLAAYYLLLATFVPLPWFVFSYLHTKNPIYPIFSGILDNSHNFTGFNLLKFFRDFLTLFYRPQDPMTPVFLIFLPLVLLRVVKGKIKDELRVIVSYCLLAFVFWYFTPRTGGSRFFLPYLPALSFLLVSVVSSENSFLKKSFVFLAIMSAFINISYRTLANWKFVPVIFGREQKDEFLSRRLNFKSGDFFDINGEIKEIVKSNFVKIEDSHNLFFADFPFVHSSFSENFPVFYVLTQNNEKVKKEYGSLVYSNYKTGVKLYLYKGKI